MLEIRITAVRKVQALRKGQICRKKRGAPGDPEGDLRGIQKAARFLQGEERWPVKVQDYKSKGTEVERNRFK